MRESRVDKYTKSIEDNIYCEKGEHDKDALAITETFSSMVLGNYARINVFRSLSHEKTIQAQRTRPCTTNK
jgi:hypothetical protein